MVDVNRDLISQLDLDWIRNRACKFPVSVLGNSISWMADFCGSRVSRGHS